MFSKLTYIDGIIYATGVLTGISFLGLAVANSQLHGLGNNDKCDAGSGVARMVVESEVAMFTFNMIALLFGLLGKMEHTEIDKFKDSYSFAHTDPVLAKKVKDSKFFSAVSLVALFLGGVALTISVVGVIQIKIGRLGCSLEADLTCALLVLFFSAFLYFVWRLWKSLF